MIQLQVNDSEAQSYHVTADGPVTVSVEVIKGRSHVFVYDKTADNLTEDDEPVGVFDGTIDNKSWEV